MIIVICMQIIVFKRKKEYCLTQETFFVPGLYSKNVPIVPVLVETWSGQVNSGPW